MMPTCACGKVATHVVNALTDLSRCFHLCDDPDCAYVAFGGDARDLTVDESLTKLDGALCHEMREDGCCALRGLRLAGYDVKSVTTRDGFVVACSKPHPKG